jgi:hypothetical protein
MENAAIATQIIPYLWKVLAGVDGCGARGVSATLESRDAGRAFPAG